MNSTQLHVRSVLIGRHVGPLFLSLRKGGLGGYRRHVLTQVRVGLERLYIVNKVKRVVGLSPFSLDMVLVLRERAQLAFFLIPHVLTVFT